MGKCGGFHIMYFKFIILKFSKSFYNIAWFPHDINPFHGIKPINALEGQIGLQKNMSDQWEINCDNNEQYNRRTSIWIHGIEVPENESVDNLVAVVKSCHERVNVLFDQDNIDHVHRAGKKYTYENTGNKIQSVIVKINLWKSLKEFYDARPRNFVNGKKRPGLNFSNVFVDLTRKR